eukprot:CAMPEP_0197022704 /NCGR_PEP_ID=MMETSP1384-20130603/3518_1 /TAXON_ID=29189 /ORGANISM="Ammonia sp." /LENGTH=421 /DNA_ID=CAMNT_0042450789 /DNA_START=22 /DNA_END=1284 /DNA_ORIENTATION=+
MHTVLSAYTAILICNLALILVSSAPVYIPDNTEVEFAYTLGDNEFIYVYPDGANQIYTFHSRASSITITTWIPVASPDPWKVVIKRGDAVWPTANSFNVETLLRSIGENSKNQGWGGIFYKYGTGCAMYCDWSSIQKSHTLYITVEPQSGPTLDPTPQPTPHPTLNPTGNHPTTSPTRYPTDGPSKLPTARPTLYPSSSPTNFPSIPPTESPSAAPTFYQNPYCPAAHVLSVLMDPVDLQFSEYAECRSNDPTQKGSTAIDYQGKLTCNPWACCLCQSINCGASGFGCKRLIISDYGAIGVSNIFIESNSVLDGDSKVAPAMGASFFCDAFESCKNTFISGKYISDAECSGAYGCQNSHIVIEPAKNLWLSCDGLLSCADASIEVNVGAESEVSTIEALVFSGQRAGEGATVTIRNLSPNW